MRFYVKYPFSYIESVYKIGGYSDDAFIDVGGVSRLGNSSLFIPSITFPVGNSGNTDFYYHNYRN
jgi:hypothetical protein